MDGSGLMDTSAFMEGSGLMYGSGGLLGEMNDTSTNVSNVTQLACEVLQVRGRPVPLGPTSAAVMRYIQAVYYLLAIPVGLGLNAFVIALIAKIKRLQNTSFFLIMEIIALDVVIAFILYPVTAANVLADAWVFGDSLCTVIGFILFFLRLTRNLLMFVLTTDRLLSVFTPFWYPQYRIRIIVPSSIAVWILSFFISLPGVRGLLDCYSFQRFTYSCSFSLGCNNREACSYYRIFATTISNGVLLLSFIMYIAMFIKAKKLKNRVAPPVTSTTGITAETSSADDEETALLAAKRKREWRATITFSYLFLGLIGVSIPGFLYFAFGSVILAELGIQRPPEGYVISSIIARSLYSALVIIDPITLMRNADMREEIAKYAKKMKAKFSK